MKRKADLDRAVACEIGMPVQFIAKITASFIDALISTLVSETDVHLDRLGKLHVSIKEGGVVNLTNGTFKKGEGKKTTRHIDFRAHVYFSKARPFAKKLEASVRRRKSWKKKTKK